MTQHLFDDPERLLAETRALRRLAGQLVADHHAADDLVQGTWLTALRRSSSLNQGKGWLRGVLRNLQRQERRGDKRRKSREQAAAQIERQLGDENDLERLEVLQALVSAVRALPQPYRSTVMARFFEDRSPNEIAERQGLPLATVRTRLHRALVMLRETMDRNPGTRSQDWRRALVLLTSAETLIPVMVMSSKLKLASLALATICLVWTGAHFLLPPGEQIELQPERGVFGPAVALAGAEVAAMPNIPDEVSTSERQLVVLPAEPELAIPAGMIAVTGVVRDDAGRPIADARVWAGKKETRTSSDGSYRILLDQGRGTRWLQARAEGHATTSAHFDLESLKRSLDLDLTLHQEFRISGRVLDVGGKPVEGAKVSANYNAGRAVISGPDGSFMLTHLDPGRPKYALNATKRGFVRAWAEVQTFGEEVAQDLILDRGNRVEGLVVDANGEPIIGASIYIGFNPNAYERLDANSDEAGNFTFPAVRPGNQTLVVQHADYATTSQVIAVPSRPDTLALLRIELSQGRSVAGRVLDQNGMPISGASLQAVHKDQEILRKVTSDERGRFRLDHLPESELAFNVQHEDYLRLRRHEVGDDEIRAELILQKSGKIVGRVLDARNHQPLKNFTVRLILPPLEPGETRLWGISSTFADDGYRFTDADGRWSTGDERLPPGVVFGLEISADGFATKKVGGAVVSADAEPEPVVVELFAGTRLFGVVIADDQPVAGAKISIYRGDLRLMRLSSDHFYDRNLTHSDTAGNFEFKSCEAGKLYLKIEHEDYGFMVHGPIHLAPGQLESEERIVLHPGWTLAGQLHDATGQPRPGVEVALRNGSITGPSRTWRTETGPSGEFRFEHLSSGSYELRDAYHLGNKEGWTVARWVQVEGFDQTNVTLRPGSDRGEVWGKLRASSSLQEPVLVQLMGTMHIEQVVGNGSFRFSRLPPGKYRIYVHHWDSIHTYQGEVEFELETDESREVDVKLKTL